jgi:hypothetical protein
VPGIVVDIAVLLVFLAVALLRFPPVAGRGIAIAGLPRGIDSLDAAPPSVI